MATVDIAGQQRSVCAMYTPELAMGDWVYIQNGFVMEVLEEADARLALETIQQYRLIEQVNRNAPETRSNTPEGQGRGEDAGKVRTSPRALG